ncbi:hypothetical protein V8E36_008088 [Tilletia maclaganii]
MTIVRGEEAVPVGRGVRGSKSGRPGRSGAERMEALHGRLQRTSLDRSSHDCQSLSELFLRIGSGSHDGGAVGARQHPGDADHTVTRAGASSTSFGRRWTTAHQSIRRSRTAGLQVLVRPNPTRSWSILPQEGHVSDVGLAQSLIESQGMMANGSRKLSRPRVPARSSPDLARPLLDQGGLSSEDMSSGREPSSDVDNVGYEQKKEDRIAVCLTASALCEIFTDRSLPSRGQLYPSRLAAHHHH